MDALARKQRGATRAQLAYRAQRFGGACEGVVDVELLGELEQDLRTGGRWLSHLARVVWNVVLS